MKQLFINRDTRKLSIRGFVGCDKKPCVIINCMEYWEPCDEDDEPEQDDAAFYPKVEDIDVIIEKLKEAKEYLKA